MQKLKFVGLFFLIITFLSVNPIFPQTDEIRVLKILVAADQGYQEWVPRWQEEITKLANEASMHFENQAGIKIKIVAFENWRRRTSGRQDWKALLAELSEAFPRTEQANFEVVMGLTSDSNSHGADVLRGYFLINCRHSYVASQYQREIYFWLSDFSRAKIFPSLILHELGHIFGCGHSLNEREAMYAYAGSYSLIFCKENIEIIKKNKWRKFKSA
jgi:hypothetical protein